jgi:hypothetical protein
MQFNFDIFYFWICNKDFIENKSIDKEDEYPISSQNLKKLQ